MEKFEARNLEGAIELAKNSLGVLESDLWYKVIFKKEGIFNKKVIIEAATIEDIKELVKTFIVETIVNMDIEIIKIIDNSIEDRVAFSLDTTKNNLLIGKFGINLKSLTDLAKMTISNSYKKYLDLSIDIADYKKNKYVKLIDMAKKIASEVVKTKIDVELDPMTNDERKVIHKELIAFPNIETKSKGNGRDRKLVIKYKA